MEFDRLLSAIFDSSERHRAAEYKGMLFMEDCPEGALHNHVFYTWLPALFAK